MSIEALGEAWRAQKAVAPIERTPTFREGGLILGAGTVLAGAEPGIGHPEIRLRDGEARLRTLLAVAYERDPTEPALAHIRRALHRWSEGEEQLAEVHLALSGLGKLQDPDEAARRLFLADGLLEAGAAPETILKALDLDESAEALRRFDPKQPRVAAGSGRTSGQWTAEPNGGGPPTSKPAPASRGPDRPSSGGSKAPASVPKAQPRPLRIPDPARSDREGTPTAPLPKPVPAHTGVPIAEPPTRTAPPTVEPKPPIRIPPPIEPEPPPGIFAEPPSAALVARVALAARWLSAPTVFLGVLLIPTKAGGRERVVRVPGRPDLRVALGADETRWKVIEYDKDGDHPFTTTEGAGGKLQDKEGRTIGYVLPGVVAVDLQQVSPSSLKDDEPRLCPVPTPDKFGQGPDSRSRDYENQIKRMINPGETTPDGFGMALTNPFTREPVTFDDCHLKTGTMIEAKGPGYADLLAHVSPAKTNITKDWFSQSGAQVQAARERHIVWYFAEKGTADFARTLFAAEDQGREKIQIIIYPYLGGKHR